MSRLHVHQLRQHRGERPLFADLSFSLGAGEALWVRGANGVGKTSLLRILAGLSRPVAGEVRWDGRCVHRQRGVHAADLLQIGHAVGLKDDLSATENLVFAARLGGQRCDRGAAETALRQLGLPADRLDLPTRLLSQGQRRRVTLARLALPQHRALWLLDEPFTALDAASVDCLGALFGAHLMRGGLLVCTSHQPLDASGWGKADALSMVDLGRTVTEWS